MKAYQEEYLRKLQAGEDVDRVVREIAYSDTGEIDMIAQVLAGIMVKTLPPAEVKPCKHCGWDTNSFKDWHDIECPDY
jgi:hypothetical protein